METKKYERVDERRNDTELNANKIAFIKFRK